MDTVVLFVGAGPTGLMLAGFLTRLGIRPLVIDKKKGLTEAQSRALIVVPRTLETYDMLGINDQVIIPTLPHSANSSSPGRRRSR
jgi:2-polyprenyl-6-methoxyphenol hydroxylase-like FAD-dependent oxidoreductase